MAEIPDHILRRSAEARARAEGRDVEEVYAEMKGDTPPEAATPASDAPAEQAPAATTPPPAAPPAETPAASVAAASDGPTRDLEAEAEQFTVPVHI